MLEVRRPIMIGEAVERIMKFQKQGIVEWVDITECEGRFLGEDVLATMDLPHFTRSGFDGFAVRAEDTAAASSGNPLELEIIEHIAAGMVPSKKIEKNQAVRIMTGAQMPAECDAVMGLEIVQEIEKNEKKYMLIKHPAVKGDHISLQGEEAKTGDILIAKGTRINAGIVAVLATFGYEKVAVAKKPRIGIFATGSELLDVGEPLVSGRIRNSNAYMISAQIKRAGGEAVYLGKLVDEFNISFAKIKQELADFDILITTGGVSVGDYDLMPDVYKALGAEVLFNKVAMRPGSVTTVAHVDGKFLFGLSGNPSACYVGLELFVRPVIRVQLFSAKPHLRKELAKLGSDFSKANPFVRLVRSELTFENGMVKATPSGMDKSNVIISLMKANTLAILPGGTRGFKEDETVEVLLLEDSEGSEWPWQLQSFR